MYNYIYYLHFKQEYLTSRYAWLNLTVDEFDDFLKLVFPELDEQGSPVGDGDEFETIRMLFISMVNVITFG